MTKQFGKPLASPSGKTLILEPDSEFIGRFLKKEDLAEKIPQLDQAVYLIFWDGLSIIRVSSNYVLSQVDFKPDTYYYIHCTDLVEMKGTSRAPMKDFEVFELGSEDERIDVPDSVHPDQSLVLTSEGIKEVNYTYLNYPFRSAKSGPVKSK